MDHELTDRHGNLVCTCGFQPLWLHTDKGLTDLEQVQNHIKEQKGG